MNMKRLFLFFLAINFMNFIYGQTDTISCRKNSIVCLLGVNHSVNHINTKYFFQPNVSSIGDYYDIVDVKSKIGLCLNFYRVPKVMKRVNFLPEFLINYYQDDIRFKYTEVLYTNPQAGGVTELGGRHRDLYMGLGANLNIFLSKKQKIYVETGLNAQILLFGTNMDRLTRYQAQDPTTNGSWFGTSITGNQYLSLVWAKFNVRNSIAKIFTYKGKDDYMIRLSYDVNLFQKPYRFGLTQDFIQFSFGYFF